MVLLLHGSGEKCPCSEKMFGFVLQNGKLCDVCQSFFLLAKSADKPSAAGLALHAVRLIPRVLRRIFARKAKADLKIFTDNIDNKALEQVNELMSQPAFANAKVRIMPDVHAGIGCVIGFTGDLGKKVIPNIVGGRYWLWDGVR